MKMTDKIIEKGCYNISWMTPFVFNWYCKNLKETGAEFTIVRNNCDVFINVL